MLSVTETETLAAYMKPPSRYGGGPGGVGGADDSGGPAKGFVVRDAPWNAAGNKVGPSVPHQTCADKIINVGPFIKSNKYLVTYSVKP